MHDKQWTNLVYTEQDTSQIQALCDEPKIILVRKNDI
jgi:hypothetical protein